MATPLELQQALANGYITPEEYGQMSALGAPRAPMGGYGANPAPSYMTGVADATRPGSLQNQVASTAQVAGADAVSAAEANPISRNFVGNLAVKAGVPERFVGSTYMPGVLGSAAGYLLAPTVGGLANQLLGVDQGKTTRVLQGAATGAGIGSAAGPWGTLAGGLVGGGIGLLGGGDSKDTGIGGDSASKMMDAYGIDSNTQASILDTYNRLKGVDKTTAESWLGSVLTSAHSKFLEKSDPFSTSKQQASSDLAMQQLASTAMAPYVADMQQNYEASGRVLQNGLKAFSPAQREMMTPLIGQYVNMSKNVADAYALQTANFPLMNQLSKSAMAVFQQQQSGGGGLGSLSDLISQQTASNPATG